MGPRRWEPPAGVAVPYNRLTMPFVYIVRCHDGTFYTGAAKDLARRLAQHNAGQASRYTRARLPVCLVWSREVENWSAALKEERRIKGMTRCQKESLVTTPLSAPS